MILPFKRFFSELSEAIACRSAELDSPRDHVAQFFKRPDMVCETSFHSRRHSQCLVDAAEVVVKEVNRNLMRMIFNLLAESVGQPRESSHSHSHEEILPLDI